MAEETEKSTKLMEVKERPDRDITELFNVLNSSVDKMNRTSRMRGFAEGCLVTLGGVAVSGLIITAIVKRKK